MLLSIRILCFITNLLAFQRAVLAKVRGIPGVDYPNYASIPKTSFKCPDFITGFYADYETRCQVFHHCYEHRKESFLCPEGTTFNKAIKSCDYWYSSECDSTQAPYEAGEGKLKQNLYNDVRLAPVKVQTNDIFSKMAALYEPKKHPENIINKEQEEAGGENYFEDLSNNGNENFETDSTTSLRKETFLNEVRENSQKENYSLDNVKYEHDSIEEENVDIIFQDSSVKPFPYSNEDENTIGFLSGTETGGYQGTANEVKDLVRSDSLLIKRLSDSSDAPKKRKFRRKPTYVVLQTHQSDSLSPESVMYDVVQNQPIKDAYVDRANMYRTSHTETPTSYITETESKLNEDFVKMPDRKLRRNRKTLQTFADDSDKFTKEVTKFVKEYQPTNTYVDETTVHHSSYKESTFSDTSNSGDESANDIKMSIKIPKRNRKKLGLFVGEPELFNDEVKEYEGSKNLDTDEINPNLLLINTDSLILDANVTANRSEEFDVSSEKQSQNRTLGTLTVELNKSNTEKTESTKLNQDFVMSANIMSPSFEKDPEPVVFVFESDSIISETDVSIPSQPAPTQASALITSTTPNSITPLQHIENELEELNNETKKISEAQISFHELKNDKIDVMTEEVNSEKVKTNNQNLIPHLLNRNSEVEGQAHSEQDVNLYNIRNIHSEVADIAYSDEEEINSDTINKNSADGNLVYSEQEMNSEVDIAYSKQGEYPPHINSEFQDFDYSGEEMNSDDIIADDLMMNSDDMIDDQSYGIDYDILKSEQQDDQYDDQNNYEAFSGTYDMFSQTVKSDTNNNNYVLISTLSPLTTTDESSTVSVLEENNNEHILVNEDFESFENEQIGEYEHIRYIDGVIGINSEYEEGIKLANEEIDSEVISDWFNEEGTESFDGAVGTETSSFGEDNSDYVENAELHGLEEYSDLYGTENLPSQKAMESDKDQKRPSDFELYMSSENLTDISGQTNSFAESLGSFIVMEDSKYNEGDSAHLAKTPEELRIRSTVEEHLNDIYKDKNLPFFEIPEKSLGSTFVEGLKDNKTHESEASAEISEELLENFPLTENLKDINRDENVPFAKIRDSDSTKPELIRIHLSADKHPVKSFHERDSDKTRKYILSETKMQSEEVSDSDNLNSHLIGNKNEALYKSALNQLDFNPNTMKVTSFPDGFEEEPQKEEEKPIDSLFHSSSMPLPTNIFEQGLYRQNLIQDENYQINRDRIYPATFYKELDAPHGKPKNKKSTVDASQNKKYRSLNSNLPLDEMNLEDVADSSPTTYREPSLLSLLEPSQMVKRLFPVDIFGLKSSSIFPPPIGRISKPIKIKKLAALGKNLLAFKRAKLNDFKILFDSFIKEI